VNLPVSHLTIVHSNLAKGRIADLSPRADANGFVPSWSPCNTLFLGHTSVGPQNGISIGSPVLHSRPTSVWPTHRHTDHATCDICRNRPHLCQACDSAWYFFNLRKACQHGRVNMACTGRCKAPLNPRKYFPVLAFILSTKSQQIRPTTTS